MRVCDPFGVGKPFLRFPGAALGRWRSLALPPAITSRPFGAFLTAYCLLTLTSEGRVLPVLTSGARFSHTRPQTRQR